MTEVDYDRMLTALKGSKNTLAGWMREMPGYDDEAMKAAMRFAYEYPDPIERLAIIHAQREGEG